VSSSRFRSSLVSIAEDVRDQTRRGAMHAGPAGWQVAVQGQMEGCTYTDGCVMWGIECVRAKKSARLLSHTHHPTLPRSRARRSPSLVRWPLASRELLIGPPPIFDGRRRRGSPCGKTKTQHQKAGWDEHRGRGCCRDLLYPLFPSCVIGSSGRE
jgi:hypothetical protein